MVDAVVAGVADAVVVGVSLVCVGDGRTVVFFVRHAVCVLVAGQIVLRGSPREVFSHYDTLVNSGLSVPVPTETMLRLRRRGYQVPISVLTAEEAAKAIEDLVHAPKV